MGQVESENILANSENFAINLTSYSQFYYNITGLYLMTEPVPERGVVAAFEYLDIYERKTSN